MIGSHHQAHFIIKQRRIVNIGTGLDVRGQHHIHGAEQQRLLRLKTLARNKIQLTAGLGLRGFRLNLAVEGASGFEQLAELAPRIRDAVGEAKYASLQKALFD